ncbi:MAG: AAA family ATPase, partial [Planctomycetota bacterium]
EAKSGASGALKSLHQFVYDRGLDLAVRLDRNPPSIQVLGLRTTRGMRVRYRLLTLPHYLTWRLADAVRGAEERTGNSTVDANGA